MNKEDISKVLSLSCVENYFLGYFQKRFDVRKLYVESFVSFNSVVDSFLNGEVIYENYPLKRLQEVAEQIGLTSHILQKPFCLESGSLNLIRVNKEFFNNSKLLPWRADHYIAIQEGEEVYTYLNNYPLSAGLLNDNRIHKIYDGVSLIFREENKFNQQRYAELSMMQYAKILNENIKDIKIVEENMLKLRDALLVLKILRKRIFEWLQFEGENGSFDDDLSFHLQSENLIKHYENLSAIIQLQSVRKKVNISVLNEKLLQLCEQERMWNQTIKNRRGKIGHFTKYCGSDF